jgi:hypothetical protein
LKVRKTTFEEEAEAKSKAWLALSGSERLEMHYHILRRIYGEWESKPLEGQKVRIKRSFEEE